MGAYTDTIGAVGFMALKGGKVCMVCGVMSQLDKNNAKKAAVKNLILSDL
jgi:hypothetical protein